MPSKILIIDDEKEFCSLMDEFFTGEGYSVEVAYNGKEGLVKVESFKPDVILLDIKMPVYGGVEALKKIKTITSAPVIIVSGTESREIREECRSLGIFAYVDKPIDLDNIAQKVKSALSDD